MSISYTPISKKLKRGFQSHKIFVEKFGKVPDSLIEEKEMQLVSYFSNFGSVIDRKILLNGVLIRLQGTLCNSDL